MPTPKMEHKIVRLIRVKIKNIPGYLGKVTTVIGKCGFNIGDVITIHEGIRYTTRDIEVHVIKESDLLLLKEALDDLDGVVVEDIIDDIFRFHEGGKIEMVSRFPVSSLSDLRKVYTPGVANVCRELVKYPEKARIYTSIGNSVAIITDGTAILGLGDIGPVAGMPVMEGKAALFSQLVGITGVPILLNTKDPKEIIETVKRIAPSFGAILLEDIAAPACFEIEETLKKELDKPVLHDDQHGTAVVTLAAVLSACKQTGLDLSKAIVGQIGLGAAGLAIAKMLLTYGAKDVYGTDLNEEAMKRLEAFGGIATSLNNLMQVADIVVATTGVAGLIKPEMVRKGQIVLALSNPVPEIEPEEALKAGAIFAADGKAVNNVLGFPGIFRGCLDAGSKNISDAMLVKAAETIAEYASEGELVPSPLNMEVHEAVSVAVAEIALDEIES